MRQGPAPTISTRRLHGLLTRGAAVWLVFAPDRAAFGEGHIPGSLTATDAQLLASLPGDAPVVVYGEHRSCRRAEDLAAALAHSGRDARWYAGGLRAWTSAGLPLERSTR